MVTLELVCPLCCTETFDNVQALKYHLLSIIDNILCPSCGFRCQTIFELTQHLDTDCSAKAVKSNENKNVFIKMEEDSNDATQQEDMTTEDNPNENENVAEELNEVYSCLTCGINFTSIVDHIQEYHEGEEVVVEMSEESQNDAKENASIMKSISEGTAIISEDNDLLNNLEEDSENDNVGVTATRNRMPQILNTIKQEECLDKDGRVYTRKVVQIEKFWDDEKVVREPLILKYLVNSDGTLEKLNNAGNNDTNKQIMEIFQCKICTLQFSKRDQFDNHACEPEIGSGYKCSSCDLNFTNSQSLSSHMKTHKKIKTEEVENPTGPFVCTTCDTVFPTNKSLRLHRRMHDPIKAKEIIPPVEYGLTGTEIIDKIRDSFECKVCGKTYDKSYEEVHMAFHSGVNFYDCFICNRKFYTQSNLEMHMRVHGTGKEHICSHCEKGFLTEESLAAHLKQHCLSRAYQCSYCSRRFSRPHEKVKHERIHTGEKPHECEICGKTFRVSYCLTLHLRTHSGYRPYICQHCGKRFKAHSVYNHHLLTHSDVRRYKCPYCPKAFKTGVQLAGHKNSHTKPFSCTHCNRPFASLYAVRAHMETHKRENNLKYKCYLCGASYARAFALRDHIKELHMNETQNDVALDIIEEGMEASSSILPENDEISMASLEIATNVNEEEEVTEQEQELVIGILNADK